MSEDGALHNAGFWAGTPAQSLNVCNPKPRTNQAAKVRSRMIQTGFRTENKMRRTLQVWSIGLQTLLLGWNPTLSAVCPYLLQGPK